MGCSISCPDGSVGKESACHAGDPGLSPGLGRSPGEGQPTPVILPGKSHGESDTTKSPHLCILSYLCEHPAYDVAL